MKKFCLALIFCLLVGSAYAQKRASRIIFNGGVQKARMYQDLFLSTSCIEGCTIVSQTPALGFDFNTLYQVFNKNNKLSFVYGVGINQKSWNEKGLGSNGAGPIDNPYSFRSDLIYVGVFYGINYNLPIGKKTKLVAGSLLNPELLINNKKEYYNSIGSSIRMTLGLEYQAYENFAIQLTPYFQTGIMNYGKTPQFMGGPNPIGYTPYSFGLNLGLVLNRIAD